MGRLWVHLGCQRVPNSAHGSHFDALWGERCKSENYAPVQAGASLLWSQGVLRDLDGTTLRTLSLACVLEHIFYII